MITRNAVISDIPQLLEFGPEYWASTPYAQTGMPYNEEAYTRVLTNVVENHYMQVIEDEGSIVAFIAAGICPVSLNPDYLMAQEVFWFVDSAYRGKGYATKLRELYEEDMKSIGVSFVTMQDMTTSNDMAQYLLNADYAMTERVFAKVL